MNIRTHMLALAAIAVWAATPSAALAAPLKAADYSRAPAYLLAQLNRDMPNAECKRRCSDAFTSCQKDYGIRQQCANLWQACDDACDKYAPLK